MPQRILTVFLLALIVSPAKATNEMVTLSCAQPVDGCMGKLERLAQAKGLKIFARIDHAAGAQSIGQSLRPTQLLIFGHPQGGTPLLQCSQTYGIDLPLHVLAWEDATGKRWLGYKVPVNFARKYADPACDDALMRLMGGLDNLVREAVRE